MFGMIAAYMVIVGGATAGLEVARGMVRGVGKLIEGEPRQALAEVAGGLAAPFLSLVHQATQLGAEVCQVAGVLGADGESDVRLDRAA